LAEAAGTHLLEIGDGVGPLTLTITEDEAKIEPGKVGSPAITLRLSADGYVRLITGRYPLSPAIAAGDAQVDGDQRRAEALNMVFAGVANG
jgi:putative sterol carrier protein